MGKKVAIVQVACGFARQPANENDVMALGRVDHLRSAMVEKWYDRLQRRGDDVQVWTTGQVAWGPASEMPEMTLASLNSKKFSYTTVRQVPGLNAFSESYNALKMAKTAGIDVLYVVVSSFYLVAYRRMWEAAAIRLGVDLRIIEVDHEDGLVASEVVDFYKSAQPQILSRIAASCDLGHRFAKFLADKKAGYRATTGFRIDGYNRIG